MKLITTKHTFLILAFISIAFNNVFCQSTSLAGKYYDKLEVKVNLPILTNKYIDRKAAKRVNISPVLWNNVKNSIDYESFKDDVLLIIPDYFEDSELQELINLNSDRPHIPITKYQFKEKIYSLAASFQKEEIIKKINTMLIDNGQEPFSVD